MAGIIGVDLAEAPLQEPPIHRPRQLRKRMVHADDLIEPGDAVAISWSAATSGEFDLAEVLRREAESKGMANGRRHAKTPPGWR
jgi:hypothetical protein